MVSFREYAGRKSLPPKPRAEGSSPSAPAKKNSTAFAVLFFFRVWAGMQRNQSIFPVSSWTKWRLVKPTRENVALGGSQSAGFRIPLSPPAENFTMKVIISHLPQGKYLTFLRSKPGLKSPPLDKTQKILYNNTRTNVCFINQSKGSHTAY